MKRILLVVFTVLIAGCGFTESSDTDGKTLDVELPLKPSSIAPYESFVPTQIGATETLFTVYDGELEKTLVEDYEQKSDDTLEIIIKDGIKFQNNHDLTGEAVKASIEQSLEESSQLKGSLPIESIDVDGQKVTIKTSEAYPNLANELANPFIAIYDTNSEQDENDLPIGTGPYEIKDYQRTKKINLEQYKDYWQGEPQLDEVEVVFHEEGDMRTDHLIDGNVDVTTDIPIERIDDVESNEGTKVSAEPGYRTSYMIYNFDSENMTKHVREAMDSIINRESIVDNIFNGYATVTTSAFADEEIQDNYDREHAKRLMEEEGYSEDNPLTLTVATYDGRPELTKMLEAIQSDAKEAHINIEIQSVDDIESFLEDKSNFDASMYNFLTEPRGNNMYYFEMVYLPDGPGNKGAYNNEKVTKLIEKRSRTIDEGKQREIDNEILSITDQDIVNSYIARTDNVVGFNDQVTGIKATPEGIELIDYQVDIRD